MKHYGLIGRTLGHSFSAKWFSEKFTREGISSDYSLIEIDTIEEIRGATKHLSGFNVTIPYKQAIIPYLSSISPEAAAINAVNCVKVCPDGTLSGYNTDVEGIRISLDKFTLPQDCRALVLGTGGASAAVQYILSERKIEYKTVSRTRDKGMLIYDELENEDISTHQLIINTTPLGMYPKVDEMPAIPYDALTEQHILFDLVYNPLETRFLKEGKIRQAKVLNGLEMLYAQAEASWRIWNE